MKVKLLKRLTLGKKGEVVTVSDEMGRFLIRYNNAVPIENPDKPKKVKKKSEKEHKEDWDNYREEKKKINKKRRKK